MLKFFYKIKKIKDFISNQTVIQLALKKKKKQKTKTTNTVKYALPLGILYLGTVSEELTAE